jgi:hypothetical protein
MIIQPHEIVERHRKLGLGIKTLADRHPLLRGEAAAEGIDSSNSGHLQDTNANGVTVPAASTKPLV